MADTFSQADIDNAVAAATQNHEAALATARTEGAAAERTRISAILASDEGKARPKAALAAALKTGMDADAASAFLADLPKESASTETIPAGGKGDRFDAAMDSTGNPEIDAKDKAEGDTGKDEAIEQSFSASAKRAV